MVKSGDLFDQVEAEPGTLVIAGLWLEGWPSEGLDELLEVVGGGGPCLGLYPKAHVGRVYVDGDTDGFAVGSQCRGLTQKVPKTVLQKNRVAEDNRVSLGH